MAATTRPLMEGISFPKLTGATNIALRRGLTSDDARRRLTLGSNANADVSQHPVQRALGKLWARVPLDVRGCNSPSSATMWKRASSPFS
jgi:methylmalonyl-CoA mutase N-terminal domain/subunit